MNQLLSNINVAALPSTATDITISWTASDGTSGKASASLSSGSTQAEANALVQQLIPATDSAGETPAQITLGSALAASWVGPELTIGAISNAAVTATTAHAAGYTAASLVTTVAQAAALASQLVTASANA